MRLFSWNVQGLGGSHHLLEKRIFRKEFEAVNLSRKIDILLLQEHHLGRERTELFKDPLPGDWHTWWAPAHGVLERRGGVCISVRKSPDIAILDHGILIEGRVMFCYLEWRNVKFGVLNVYAPNSSSERTSFWSELANKIPSYDNWIVAGYFNMTERTNDCLGAHSNLLQGGELRAWGFLTAMLGIKDSWYSSMVVEENSLRFSRFGWKESEGCHSRLDRIYVSPKIEDWSGCTSILAGFTYSDHLPISLTLDPIHKKKSECNLRIPSKIFGIQKVKEEVINIWSASPSSDDPIQVLEEKIINSSHALQKAAREELVRCRSQLQRLRKAVTSAQKLTQVYPHCSWAKDRLQEATRVLQEIRQQREQFLFRKSAAQWAVKGDKVNSEFFLTKAPKLKGKPILSLKREDDSVTTDQDEILQMATKYYRDLLAPTLIEAPLIHLMQHVVACLKTKIGEVAKLQLSKTIEKEEIVAGLDKIHSRACPGVDGLPKAFFVEFWEHIFPSLEAGFQEMWRTGRMPSSFNEGLIYLIPKSEKVSHEIRQWRPITILNLVYKNFANILVQRVKPFLGDIIQTNQTGFMEHRSIMDNVILFWEAVATARETNQNLACLMLDFKKAYDRVQWYFLEEVMKVIELPWEWRRAAQALYKNGSSKVLIAGRKGATISLTRSIRQGCPLAPFLFLFITEAMSAFLNSQTANLHGLSIPNTRKSLLDSEFADDTMLYLQGNEANLGRAQIAIDLFCKASGAAINWNKSKGFWISSEAEPIWKPNADFRWIAKGEGTRYLGTWIGVDIDKGIQMQQIQAKSVTKFATG